MVIHLSTVSICPKKLRTKADNIPSPQVRRQVATEWGVVVRDGPIPHHTWVQTCQRNVSSSKLCPLSYRTFPHGKPECLAPWRSFSIPSPTGCGCRGSAQGDVSSPGLSQSACWWASRCPFGNDGDPRFVPVRLKTPQHAVELAPGLSCSLEGELLSLPLGHELSSLF